MSLTINKIYPSKKFERDYKNLPSDIRKCVNKALIDLLKSPIPTRLRLKKYKGHSNPSVYAVHITNNHSHKMSMEIRGTDAFLRYVGTHKDIDRSP